MIWGIPAGSNINSWDHREPACQRLGPEAPAPAGTILPQESQESNNSQLQKIRTGKHNFGSKSQVFSMNHYGTIHFPFKPFMVK
jgi:hypothetical protein